MRNDVTAKQGIWMNLRDRRGRMVHLDCPERTAVQMYKAYDPITGLWSLLPSNLRMPLSSKVSYRRHTTSPRFGGGGGGGGGWGNDDKMSNLGGGLRSIDWNTTKLEHFEKNFYVEDKRVAARSDRDIDEFRRGKEMKVGPTLSTKN